ncbi:MAG: preprotein translocase subunit SecE [Elusimicrobia bacterium RIFOXYB2_FULL_49_7]|nr:MAG: preprotein translocase subunit SecE [Elusimicrobia bacterium RIFOXYB2_FULL_49_7]
MKKIVLYLTEVVAELKKVVWPTRDMLFYSTILVVVISLMFAFYIMVADKILTQIVGLIL